MSSRPSHLALDPGVPLGGHEATFARLAGVLEGLGRVVVAFSGGADSALLAWAATAVLGRTNALCVTATSASLAPWEVEDVERLAAEWDLRWLPVRTLELDNPAYEANGPDRCRHCKDALFDELEPLAASEGAALALGVNLDDLGDFRPGQDAAVARGAVFPLVTAGLSKADVRGLSKLLGLRTWDKPAAACLASRVPHGSPVTLGVLDRVAAAEGSLRRLGLRQVRVRHYGDMARIEVGSDEIELAFASRADVVGAVRAAGYNWVTLDLEGFRSGNLSEQFKP